MERKSIIKFAIGIITAGVLCLPAQASGYEFWRGGCVSGSSHTSPYTGRTSYSFSNGLSGSSYTSPYTGSTHYNYSNGISGSSYTSPYTGSTSYNFCWR